jgi:PAS domain S-box-containing protein
MAGVWLLMVVAAGSLVHSGETERRQGLRQRFAARVQTGAAFVHSYTTDVLAREHILAERTMRTHVSAAEFGALMADDGFQAAVLLNGHGDLIVAYPADPALVGKDIGAKYAHLRGALAGVPTVSAVVPSAVRHSAVVGFAEPFETPSGRRVFSGAYAVSGTPLQPYLVNQIEQIPGEAFLVDSAGSVAASGAGGPVSGDLSTIDPQVAAVSTQPGTRIVGAGAARQLVVTVAVPSTPWRLVFATPLTLLYQSDTGFNLWAARIILLALAIAGLLVVALIERTIKQRSRLAEQQVRSRAVLDTAVDAFAGMDDRGRITDWNPAAEAMFGWSADEAIGQSVQSLILPDRYHGAFSEGMARFARTGRPPLPTGGDDLVGLGRDGQEIPIEVSVSSARLASGWQLYAFVRDVRPRRAAEEKMRTLAQVVDSAGDAIYGLDLEGRVISWNASAERMFGWTAAEMTGQGEHPMIGPGRVAVEAAIHAVADTRTMQQLETPFLAKDGQRVDVALTLAPLVGDRGVLMGVSASARDVSERRRLEGQLRQSESVFRSAFDDALLGMCLIGLDGRLNRVNPVFAEILARPADELVGMYFEDLYRPEDCARNRVLLHQALTGEIDGYRDERRYVRGDGADVWADVAASLIRDSAGQPLHIVTQVIDVTKRREALRERDSRDAMLRAIIANSQSVIYVKDLEGRYLLANEPWERTFSVTEAEVLGQTDEYLDPARAPSWRASDLLALDGAYHLDEWVAAVDGPRYFESVKFPLLDSDRQPYAICSVGLDVTERRHAAIAVADARDEALAATAAKSAFLATMSHEIRTPMNAVIGMTGLLLDTDLDASQRDYAETVRSSGDSLLAIINNVLDYSKIESGQLELELQPFDLEDLIEGAVELAAIQRAAGGLEILADVAPTSPRRLVGDVTRLRQVLVNLVANAVKFTAQGQVMVTVSVTESPGHELDLHVAVSDTGIGIPDDRMHRLFRSFSQVEASTNRSYGGTGLGLAISARLIGAMGGRIEVESEPGIGSTFSFTIPTARPHVEGSTVVTPEPDQLQGRRVLVVAGNADNRRILQRRLAGWGATSDAAASGADALRLVIEKPQYDVAVVDRDMPDMNGLRLGAALHARMPSAKLALVLMGSRQAGQEKHDPAHFSSTVAKPTKSIPLLRALVSAIEAPSAPAGRDRDEVPEARPSPLRILLAEDNPVNQRVAVLILHRLGYRTDIAGNGLEAVAALHRALYDVVLMDVQMPELDGLQATIRIRAELPPDRQPVIIAMTANAMTEDRKGCLQAGMDGYIVKPFRREELAVALANCTVRAPSDPQLVPSAAMEPVV